MEKQLRSALRSSAEDFLAAAVSAAASTSRQAKSALKTLIWGIPPSSPLSSSLPPALHLTVSHLLDSFKISLQHPAEDRPTASPLSPHTKRACRRSKSPPPSPPPSPPNSQAGAMAQLRSLRTCAWITHLCVSHPRKSFSPPDLLPCVRSLHDCLVLFEMDEVLLSDVASLCEQWWKEKLPEKETLISQSLPFLLSRSLTRNKKADVHRVYALRDAFQLFDFMDESIEDLRLLLVRCVITPLYLKSEEGRRFTAFMMGLNGQLLKETLALIRSQIVFGRKAVLEAYADILFRAWKCSEGDMRAEMEDVFLLGLIEGAIFACSKSLAASVRRVLGVFLENRATDGVDKLLFRLVEPILFRSLQVANSNVRQNALHLLIDMFPLEDPDVTREVKNVLLDKQFFLLERLLVDDSPDVRAVAVEGCCRILHLFWEVIPSPTITKILTRVVGDTSRDVCNDVKLSTLNGLTYLLGNPQTHDVLKVLIPRLGYMFLDPILSVRLAVCDLLLTVRDIRSFQFNQVVDLDALLSSLANDHPLVARKVTRLLMPSYFPSKIPIKEACNRFVMLTKRSPAAGARFCEFALLEGTTSKSLVELARVCFSLAVSAKDLNSAQIDGLFTATANICSTLSTETSCQAALNTFFSKEKLKSLLTATTSLKAQNSILSIVSLVSPKDLDDFHDDCMRLITNCVGLSNNVEMQAEVRRIHKLMLSNGWFEDLFGALADILQITSFRLCSESGIETAKSAVQSQKKKRAKLPRKFLKKMNYSSGTEFSCLPASFTKEDYDAVGSAAAWQVKDLLASTDTRNEVLHSSFLKSVSSSLGIISQLSIERSIYWEIVDLLPVFAYTSLSLHMHLRNVGTTAMEDPRSNSNFKSHSTASILEGTTLEDLLNHLLNSAEKHFCVDVPGKSFKTPLKVNQVEKSAANTSRRFKRKAPVGDSSSASEGVKPDDNFLGEKRIRNTVQIGTTLLKFIVDAVTMGQIPVGEQRWICFASLFVRHVILAIKRHQDNKIFYQNLKENLLFLKSSFSYAAKLLHLVISKCDKFLQLLPEISSLANGLLDLIASMELYLTSGYASHIISVAKPWLPDLIMGLSSSQLTDATQMESGGTAGGDNRVNFPVWFVLLSKIELCELRECSEDEEGNGSRESGSFAFKKLIEMVLILLKKGNPKVLEAVGIVLLKFMKVGLETEDFNLVLGSVHFICVKLIGEDDLGGDELETLYSHLQESYMQIEHAITDLEHDENGKRCLEMAKELIRSHSENHLNT